MRKLFITAAEVLPGDRLYKHGAVVTSTETDIGCEGRPVVRFGYTHTSRKGTWLADRRFHVGRKESA